MLLILAVLAAVTRAQSDYTYMNCYVSLPSDFSSDNTYAYQTSSYCYSRCQQKGAAYFALFNHNQCFCGNTSPSSQTSSSCNTYCFGYAQEMCGILSLPDRKREPQPELFQHKLKL